MMKSSGMILMHGVGGGIMFHGCLESIALLISKPPSTASSVAIIVRTTQDCGA
jgi:hypothetical protein